MIWSRSRDYDEDYQQVAIFASGEGIPTHMARQLPHGAWTSKLGGLEDVAHTDVDGVGGAEYGEIVVFMQRRKTSLS
jgi:hypothetical protein